MKKKKGITGVQDWKEVCTECGLCCLQQYFDDVGNVYLTRIKCNYLGYDNKCWCDNPDEKYAPNGFCHRVSVLDKERLTMDYVVPVTCPWVQKFVKKTNIKVPDLSGVSFVCAANQEGCLKENVIPGTSGLFKYNPHVNKILKDFLKKTK